MSETKIPAELVVLNRISTWSLITVFVLLLAVILASQILPEAIHTPIGFSFIGVYLIFVFSTTFLFVGSLFRRQWKMFAWATVKMVGVVALTIMFIIPSRASVDMALAINNRNNIKILSLALLNYAAAHDGQLPPHKTGAEPDENGIYPHSWRVYILPFVEEDGLFKKIRLNEPWDSEWNRQFHEKMPTVFKNPVCREWLSDSDTTYGVLTGAEMAFPENGDGRKITELRPDLALITETAPGCWMDPNHDVREIRSYGKYEEKVFGYVDGSVHQSKKPITREDVKTMVWEE
ncbi:MAG: DUF1559 domain-containing protein [Planctomycetia bacterium]|nr:DUF1559 domain-containing protein [Planctomycetia bacterium]